MLFQPVLCEIQAPANPNIRFSLHIVEEARKAGGSAGMAKEPHMHPHIHHFGRLTPLFIQEVKSFPQDREEVLPLPRFAVPHFKSSLVSV